MFKIAGSLLALALAALPLHAQGTETPGSGRCAVPDTITVTGVSRVDETTVRGTIGLVPHTTLNYRDVQRAVKALYATGNYDDVKVICTVTPANRVVMDVQVKERPLLAATAVHGAQQVSAKDVREMTALSIGAPVDPAKVAIAVTRTDSLYASKGYYLARVTVDSTLANGQLSLTFNIDEGRRLAVSGVGVSGNRRVSTSSVVGAMSTKPEGFWWFRNGEFDDATFAGDLTDRIPSLYGSRGFIDFRLLGDTLIVDRTRGKGEIQIKVQEGPRYTVGNFEVVGNKAFSLDQLHQFYPFDKEDRSLAQGALGFIRRSYQNPTGTFDESRWNDATDKVKEAYGNEGYIYAVVRPVEERVPSTDSTARKVNLRWDIREGSPAIVNRIDIAGNDFTYESCIREQIVMAPGQVFKRDYLIRSYQNIANLNFFDSPMPEPDVRPDSAGDVDITFKVKEKRTGNVNFGASMGQGTGLGGFIGLDQPNLFGRCKRASLNWQFGKYLNDFSLTYSDPNIRDSRISGSITAYDSKARYTIADLGQSTRVGGQLQFGFPVPHSYFSRVFLTYGGESVKYADNSGTLFSTILTSCSSCFRSSLGASFQHDTRLGLPFATQGGMQSFSASFNGGPLGGTASFQKYTTELRSYAPLAYIGGNALGSQPLTFVAGLSARAGAVLGDPGPFFSSQSFALGGTQYGEPLRGYCEFAITPAGYDPSACDGQAKRQSFGNAFFVGTAELGLRINQSVYLNTFFEGGNVWNKPREFDPTRLFRSVGFGGSIVSPLGPLGLDVAYGLDRVDAQGRSAPAWKVHFKLGQYF